MPKFISVAEAAKLASVAVSTVYGWRRTRAITSYYSPKNSLCFDERDVKRLGRLVNRKLQASLIRVNEVHRENKTFRQKNEPIVNRLKDMKAGADSLYDLLDKMIAVENARGSSVVPLSVGTAPSANSIIAAFKFR